MLLVAALQVDLPFSGRFCLQEPQPKEGLKSAVMDLSDFFQRLQRLLHRGAGRVRGVVCDPSGPCPLLNEWKTSSGLCRGFLLLAFPISSFRFLVSSLFPLSFAHFASRMLLRGRREQPGFFPTPPTHHRHFDSRSPTLLLSVRTTR